MSWLYVSLLSTLPAVAEISNLASHKNFSAVVPFGAMMNVSGGFQEQLSRQLVRCHSGHIVGCSDRPFENVHPENDAYTLVASSLHDRRVFLRQYSVHPNKRTKRPTVVRTMTVLTICRGYPRHATIGHHPHPFMTTYNDW